MDQRNAIESSPLLSHMKFASGVSSHTCGAFPSGGSNLHTWPGLLVRHFFRSRQSEVYRHVDHGMHSRYPIGPAVTKVRIISWQILHAGTQIPGQPPKLLSSPSRSRRRRFASHWLHQMPERSFQSGSIAPCWTISRKVGRAGKIASTTLCGRSSPRRSDQTTAEIVVLIASDLQRSSSSLPADPSSIDVNVARGDQNPC